MEKATAVSNKEKAVALLKSLETRDSYPVSHINPKKYIQHNLMVEDGLAGLQKLTQWLPPDTKVNVVRAFEDGDFVFVHAEYNFGGPIVGFDVFRFEEGKMVEHWDNLQKREAPNPSGHSMTDGATEISDRNNTEANKTLARSIVDDVLVNGKVDKLAGYFNGDDYVQHNPWFADKVSGLMKGLAELAKQGIVMKYSAIHRVLGEGNFVLVISEGHLKGVHSGFYDLFRIENGKIAEHWDTIEEIPAEEKHKNSNGKF